VTYAEKFREAFGDSELADFLLAAPEPSEIEDGMFSKEAVNAVEHLFLKTAEQRIKGFYMPAEVGHGTDPNNKWRTISSLQKSIRFGLIDDARFAVSAAFDMDKSHTLKRLGVIAVEDCMMGNPLYVGIILAALGHAHWRKTLDERRFMIWMAGELAAGDKDRTAVNLLVTADREELVPKDEWATAPDMQLIAAAMNDEFTHPQRMCACWLLAGTKRYQGHTFPEWNDRKPIGLFQMMVEQGASRFLLYVAAKTASRLGEAMFATMPMIHDMLSSCPEPWIMSQNVYPRRVGKLLGAAYDQYTREGKVAIKKFFRESSVMKPFVDLMSPSVRDRLQYGGVFHAEGGCLSERVVYGEPCMGLVKAVGGPERFGELGDAAHEYLEAIRSDLDFLNECRKQVLWAAIHQKQ
jgi:hypothetical protein